MIIFRYLVKEVYGNLLATTGVLLLILISNQLVHYLNQAAAGVVPVRTVMQMMSLQVPMLLGLLLPLGLFLGILMAYGRLYNDREMIVLFACGFSKARLIGITLLFSAMVAIVVGILMLWVQPKMEAYKSHILAEASASSPLEKIFPDQFVQLDNGKLVVYARDLTRDHQRLEKIFVAQPSGANSTWNILMAKSASHWQDPQTQDRFIVFNDGYRYTGAPGQRDFQVVKYEKYGVRYQQNVLPQESNPYMMTTAALFKNRHDHPQLEAELQWRISLPLSVLILSLIATALSSVKPRQGRYTQILPAMLIYIIYADFLFMAQAWLQKGQVSNGIGMWWVHLLMLLVAGALLIRYVGFSQILNFFRFKAGA